MKVNKIILCLIAFIISINVCGLSAFASEESQNSDWFDDCVDLLEPMTEDEIRLKEETSVLSKYAYLNDLALERINEQFKEDGMDEVSCDTAAMGEEIVTTEDSMMTFSSQSLQSLIPFLKKVDNSTDERTAKYMPPHGYQGGFGSCGAFASTYYQMTYMNALVKGYDFTTETDVDSKILSPKFTYNIGKKADNKRQGVWPSTAYAIVQKHGCPSNKDFKYVDFYTTHETNASDYRGWPTEAEIWTNALKNKVQKSGWGNIGDLNELTPVKNSQDPNLNLIKTLLANGYILNVVTPIGWVTEDLPNDGIICVEVTSGDNMQYHAMTVVGYDDDFSYTHEGVTGHGAFKLIDSKKEDYECWFAYDALNAKSALFPDKERLQGWVNNEFTWVTMYKNYRPKLLAEFKITTNNRGAVDLSLGYGNALSSEPSEQWKPFIFNETKYIDDDGGNNSFNINGTKNEEENSATVILDYTDLINEKEADRIDEELEWYLSSNSDISDFKIIEMRIDDAETDVTEIHKVEYPSVGTLPNDTGTISCTCQLPLKVDKDKIWNVFVNYPLDKNSVNPNTVQIKDSKEKNTIANVLLENDTQIVVTPRENTQGKYYSLMIDGIKTVAGNGLISPVNKYFFFAPDIEDEVDYSIESSFTDEKFLDIIRDLVNKPNGVVYLSDVKNIKELDVSNSNITSLAGIEYFASLEQLNCSHNKLTELDLAKNINLKTIDVSCNELKTLDLSHNPLVTEVNVDTDVTVTQ